MTPVMFANTALGWSFWLYSETRGLYFLDKLNLTCYNENISLQMELVFTLH